MVFFKKLYYSIDLQNVIIGLTPKETNSFTAEGLVYKYPLANISAAYLSREHLSDVSVKFALLAFHKIRCLWLHNILPAVFWD